MLLTKTAINRPIFIIMFVLALLIVGIQSKSRMPEELFPKIDFPFVSVVTTYPGAGPNEMETQVSQQIEKAVSSIGGLKNVTSTSQDGVSVVGLEFELGTNVDTVAADVRAKVASIRRLLPEDIDEPSIDKADFSGTPIVRIGLEGPLSGKDMRILAEDTIRDKLSKVKGVASVDIRGGDIREIAVSVDKNRLDAYAIGLTDVVQAIRGANLNVPAGSIKEGTRDYSVRTVGEFISADEIANLPIHLIGNNGNRDINIHLGDIAKISDTVEEPSILARMNGKPTVTLEIKKQSDANTVDTAEGVLEELKAIEPTLPTGVKPVIAEDQSEFVKDSVNDVNKSLFEGIIIVVIIVFLFLHSLRATFIVAIAIPTSLYATYTPIHALGFTQNFMTLLALSLVVGILVDDSIVILENIERHVRMREKPTNAALSGRTEIGFAAVAISLVDIVVFVPIAFMGGIVGQFFRQFGITVATATMFSLLMSFTLTPMLASRWLKSQEDKERDDTALKYRLANRNASPLDHLNRVFGHIFAFWEKMFTAIEVLYRSILEWAINNRFLTITIGFVTLLVVVAMAIPLPAAGMAKTEALFALMPRLAISAITILMCLISLWKSKSKPLALGFTTVMVIISMTIQLPLGVEFQPSIDQGEFGVNIRTAPGTSLMQTNTVVRKVEAILGTIPELKKGYYITQIGEAPTEFGAADQGPQYAQISGKCVDKTLRKRSIDEITAEISKRVAEIPGAERIAVSTAASGPGGGIQLEVQGQNAADLLKTASTVARVMSSTPGAVDVDISFKEAKPERRVIVDRIKAAEFGLSTAQIAIAARAAIDGDNSAKLRDGGSEYGIRVRYDVMDRSKASNVEDLIVGSKNGSPIFLKDVAQIVYDVAPSKIDRKNRQRVIYVTCNPAQGAKLGNVQTAILANLEKEEKIPGTTIIPGGAGQIMTESFGYMGSALMMAILFVYMLMGALFESFLTPFVIMFSLPQAMAGALLALLLFGKSMSIVSMIGIIMLMGLVAKNAILMVDFTNTLRNRGKSRTEAILTAGPIRLKPILMTTMAMIGGMLPTAMAVTRGAEIRQPLAIGVIGGLTLSLLLTLIVIPVVYTIVDDFWHWILRKFAPAAEKRAMEKQRNIIEDYQESIKHKGDNWSED